MSRRFSAADLSRRPGTRWQAVGGVAGTAPTITVAPVASGTVEIGQTLSSTTGTWTGSPTSYSYQWQRDGADISGETSATYTVVAADIGPGTAGIGTGIICLVTANNAAGASSPSASNALVFAHATYLADTAIGISTAGVTLVGSGVDEWAPTLGGLAAATPAATAPSASARPTYSASGGVGGRPVVTGDGVDDALVGASLTRGAAWLDSEIGVVGQRVAFGTASDTFLGYIDAMFLNDRNTALFRFTVIGGANIDAATDPDDAPLHMSGDTDATALNVRVAGAIDGTVAAAQPSRSDGGAYSLFASTLGTRFANIAIQAWYLGGKLTSTQRDHIRALLTYHTGVSC